MSKWHKHFWQVHQRAIDHDKATIAKEVVLAYPGYLKVFEIYPDAASKQLGAVMTQDNRPVMFFSWKLSTMQRKYSVTKFELLAIVQTLKEERSQRDAMGPAYISVY
jgi:hypothetical protein